jgi:hypothetical protein
MLGCWNRLSVGVPGVLLLIALHLSRAVGVPDREQAAAIGIHEDEKIPVSEHEFPKENIRTRPDYRGEGHWATPSPDSGIELGFIPMKLYAQVRNNYYVMVSVLYVQLRHYSCYVRRDTSRFVFCLHRQGMDSCIVCTGMPRFVYCPLQIRRHSCFMHRYVRI